MTRKTSRRHSRVVGRGAEQALTCRLSGASARIRRSPRATHRVADSGLTRIDINRYIDGRRYDRERECDEAVQEDTGAGGRVLRSLWAGDDARRPVGGDFGAGARAGDHRPGAGRVSAVLEPVACCAPLAAPTLSKEEVDATAEFFKALADPARVRIVNLIATSEGAVCACEFNEAVGLAQPTVSHHL